MDAWWDRDAGNSPQGSKGEHARESWWHSGSQAWAPATLLCVCVCVCSHVLDLSSGPPSTETAANTFLILVTKRSQLL